MTTAISRSRTLDVPVDEVWAVLAAFDDIARWAPQVDHSCLLQPAPGSDGVGAVRRVQIGRTTLLETVTAWSAAERLAYDITGLPPVLRHVSSDWHLRPSGARTTVTLTTTVEAGHRPPQQLVARLAARRFARAADSLLDGLAAATATSPTTGGPSRA